MSDPTELERIPRGNRALTVSVVDWLGHGAVRLALVSASGRGNPTFIDVHARELPRLIEALREAREQLR